MHFEIKHETRLAELKLAEVAEADTKLFSFETDKFKYTLDHLFKGWNKAIFIC